MLSSRRFLRIHEPSHWHNLQNNVGTIDAAETNNASSRSLSSCPPPPRLQLNLKTSEEISAENNKLAAKKAIYDGGKKGGDAGGRKANPGSSDGGGDSSAGRLHEHRTTALASYLRKESLPVSVRLEGGAGARIPSEGADTSRRRPARDRPEGVGKADDDDNDTEEKRAGNNAPQRLRYRQNRDGGGGGGGGRGEDSPTQPQEQEQGGVHSDSGEDDSLTMPGLSGVLVTQLTWGSGSGAWDAVLKDGAGDAAPGGTGAAPAAVGAASTAIKTERSGLIGTTPVALRGNIDVHGDDDLRTPAKPPADKGCDSSDAKRRGSLERGAVQTSDREGEEEAEEHRRDGSRRRSTFTEVRTCSRDALLTHRILTGGPG